VGGDAAVGADGGVLRLLAATTLAPAFDQDRCCQLARTNAWSTHDTILPGILLLSTRDCNLIYRALARRDAHISKRRYFGSHLIRQDNLVVRSHERSCFDRSYLFLARKNVSASRRLSRNAHFDLIMTKCALPTDPCSMVSEHYGSIFSI
jgi:hypothetical protein